MITNYMADIENSIMLGQRHGVERVVDTFYIALSTTPINANGTGLTEPTDANYSRVAVPNDEYNFVQSINGVTKNAREWRYVISTTKWQPVTHWAIMDSLKGGRVLYYDALPTPMNVDVHQEVFFNPQSVVITRSGA